MFILILVLGFPGLYVRHKLSYFCVMFILILVLGFSGLYLAQIELVLCYVYFNIVSGFLRLIFGTN